MSTTVKSLLSDYDRACILADGAAEELRKAQAHHTHAQAAQALLQATAQQVQSSAHNKLTDTVTHCIAAVYDNPYTFAIDWSQKRGRTEAQLQFHRGGHTLANPMDEVGYGVLDIAAFGLRLCGLLLQTPAARRVLILDEPFKFVSKDRLPLVRDMLVALAAELGVQIIMVTHIEELMIGKVVRLN